MNDYGLEIAKHYAAYRPSLHEVILEKSLGSGAHYQLGLDIGCGTGRSCVALKTVCEEVLGAEPSREMLEEATVAPGIRYQWFDGKDLTDLPQADLITFAGAWVYAGSQQMVDQLADVATDTILLYDFEVLLGPVLKDLNLNLKMVEPSGYDHAANFTPYQAPFVRLEDQQALRIDFQLSQDELSHLILADQGRYEELSVIFQGKDLFSAVKDSVLGQFPSELSLPATCFWSRYRVN